MQNETQEHFWIEDFWDLLQSVRSPYGVHVKAEFEEKQYEQAANMELALGLGGMKVFSSGQVLESIVGYDVAADPDKDHVLWQLLELGRPKGLVLLPSYWLPSTPGVVRLPSTAVSLILQYKRPEFLRHGNARQWTMWGTPYFRFARTKVQHGILRRLEENLGEDVVVRYAAPAFWRYGDLETAQLQQHVLKSTGFVSPKELGTHHVWTYIQPGIRGRGNPAGRPIAFESIDDLGRRMREQAGQSEHRSIVPASFDTPLQRLGTAIAYRNPSMRSPADRWVRQVQTTIKELDSGQIDSLRSYALVQSAMRHIEAHWFLVDNLSD